MRTKINIILLITTFLFILSCDNRNNEHIIPKIKLDFTLSVLNIPELQVPMTPKYIKDANGRRVGYNGHGIYVMKTASNAYVAFDASCTLFNSTENHTDITEYLLQKENNHLIVYCPICKSEYNLLDGNVQKEPSKEPLKRYNTSVSGNNIRIFNY